MLTAVFRAALTATLLIAPPMVAAQVYIPATPLSTAPRPATVPAPLLTPAGSEIPPVTVPPLVPAPMIVPATPAPTPAPVLLVPSGDVTGKPYLAPLAGLSAVLGAPRSSGPDLKLTLTVRAISAARLTLARSSAQNCALAPLVRVLKVGTREVVYPLAAEPRICTADVRLISLGAGESQAFERVVTLPAGEYLVEGWLDGLNGRIRGRVNAEAVRVTIR